MSGKQQPHPKEAGPQPPFPQPQQEYPGSEAEMDPRPDFGEDSYEGRGLLEDRAAIITGGDSGIGRAVAVAFAREGADIMISYLNEHEDAEETARVVRAAGRSAELLPGTSDRQNIVVRSSSARSRHSAGSTCSTTRRSRCRMTTSQTSRRTRSNTRSEPISWRCSGCVRRRSLR